MIIQYSAIAEHISLTLIIASARVGRSSMASHDSHNALPKFHNALPQYVMTIIACHSRRLRIICSNSVQRRRLMLHGLNLRARASQIMKILR